MSEYQERAAELAARYAKNRIDISAISKRINSLTDWNRADKGIDLTELRLEYLEEGDRWRGWAHAIDVVEGFRDPEDTAPFTEDQRELAALLDQKAAMRVEAGKIKRGIYAVGRQLLVIAQ